MSNIEKEIKAARPTLRVVSPLAWWVVTVMAIFNILLGLSLLLLVDQTRFSAPLLIVNNYLTFKFWGWVFIGIGLAKIFSIVSNNWELARRSLIIGVSVKAAWAIALTVRTIVSPGTFFLNLTWITIALLQMGAYVWFMPPSTESYKQRRKDR